MELTKQQYDFVKNMATVANISMEEAARRLSKADFEGNPFRVQGRTNQEVYSFQKSLTQAVNYHQHNLLRKGLENESVARPTSPEEEEEYIEEDESAAPVENQARPKFRNRQQQEQEPMKLSLVDVFLMRKSQEDDDEPASAPMSRARSSEIGSRSRSGPVRRTSNAGQERRDKARRASRRAAEEERASSPSGRGPVDFDPTYNDLAAEEPVGSYVHNGNVRTYGNGQLREQYEASNPEEGIRDYLVRDYNRG